MKDQAKKINQIIELLKTEDRASPLTDRRIADAIGEKSIDVIQDLRAKGNIPKRIHRRSHYQKTPDRKFFWLQEYVNEK